MIMSVSKTFIKRTRRASLVCIAKKTVFTFFVVVLLECKSKVYTVLTQKLYSSASCGSKWKSGDWCAKKKKKNEKNNVPREIRLGEFRIFVSI